MVPIDELLQDLTEAQRQGVRIEKPMLKSLTDFIEKIKPPMPAPK